MMNDRKPVTEKFPQDVAHEITECVSYINQSARAGLGNLSTQGWDVESASRANEAHYKVLALISRFQIDTQMAEGAITDMLTEKMGLLPDPLRSLLDQRMKNIRKFFIPV